jgi:beta-carotene 3-hydroxylase
VGPFEDNDVFAVANALPAMSLIIYGFLTPNMAGGLAYGAGLGITLFGIAYMFVHDGLVHRRFPVGPIGDLPVLKRIAVAHQLHHSAKYKGVPWGLFLGPQELEAVGAKEELDRLVAELGERKVTTTPPLVAEGRWREDDAKAAADKK